MVRTGVAERAEDVQARIMAAAGERFSYFGYGKTTMAEIARDCGMSAGNLYRYFESKSDIGAAVSQTWFAALQAAARQSLDAAGLTPAEKLEEFVLAICRFTLDACRDKPRLQEMVDFLCEERRDLLEDHMAVLNEMLVAVIAEGNARGAFAVEDPARAARLFQVACVHFEYPPLLTIVDEARLEEEARGVVRLIIGGLRA